ncbi:MAG TPA: hypothetical protein VGE53_02590 [Candidatus Paceibacterota bacterium]
MQKQYSSDLLRAQIFKKYLNDRYGWDYDVEHPLADLVPDVDVILKSKTHREDLFLQLTEGIKFEATLARGVDGRGVPMFKTGLIREAIEKKEQKYKQQGADISNLFLLIFESLRPEQIDLNISSLKDQKRDFRGIYIISPSFLYGPPSSPEMTRTQEEWVYEIQNGFSSSPP